MLNLLAQLLQRSQPLFRKLVLISLWFIVTLLAVALFEFSLWPRLVSSQWFARLGINTRLAERVTVIERQEAVTISPDESLERLVAEHGSVVVGIVEKRNSLTTTLSERLRHSRLFPGTLVTNDGLIVTYLDEFESDSQLNQNEFQVILSGGTIETATVAGYDTLTNLLFLRINRSNTPAVAFAHLADVKTGRKVALLGTQSDGRVAITPSAVERYDPTFNLAPLTVASTEKWEGVFRIPNTDTAELTGGPALLANGDLAGIVGQNILDEVVTTFLIPADAVQESLSRLTSGQLARPKVGLSYLPISPVLQMQLQLERDRGALIYSPSERTSLAVLSGSPAAQAGLLFGDIIIAVNDKEINFDLPLSVALGRLRLGETAVLKVIRAGIEREVMLAL